MGSPLFTYLVSRALLGGRGKEEPLSAIATEGRPYHRPAAHQPSMVHFRIHQPDHFMGELYALTLLEQGEGR